VRILVLEDDAAVRHTVARVLRRDGDEIIETCCCAEARAAAHCALGIFDVQLPDGDGVVLAKELLARGTIKRVVFFTGSYFERAAAVGPVVAKGDDMGELIAAVALARARLPLSEK
jgi:DNA-binding response OmpR family regulator